MVDDLSKKLSEIGDEKICPIAVIIKGNKVLIGLRNYKKGKDKGISVWTFPGGRCDRGEAVEKTLRREVAEETGINDFLIEKFIGEVAGAKKGDIVYMFLGSTEQESKNMEPEKFSEWRWKSIKNIPSDFINPSELTLIKDFLKK